MPDTFTPISDVPVEEDFRPISDQPIDEGQQQDEAVKDRQRFAESQAGLATQLFQSNIAAVDPHWRALANTPELPSLTPNALAPFSAQEGDADTQAQLGGLARAHLGKPMIEPQLISKESLDYLTQFGPMNTLAHILPEPAAAIASGTRSAVNEFAAENTKLSNVALLGALPLAPESAAPLISGYFAKQMGEGTVNEISQAMAAQTPEERTKHIVSAVLSGAMTAAAGLHALSGIHALRETPEEAPAKPPALPPLQAKSAEVLTGINPNDAPVSPELAKTNEVLDKMSTEGAQVPAETPKQAGVSAIAPDGSKIEIQPTREGPHVITTAIEGTNGALHVGENPTDPHFDPKEAIMWQHLAQDTGEGVHPTIGGESRFIVQDAEGNVKVADRAEAGRIAEEAKQRRPETYGTDLKSQDLIPSEVPKQPEAAKLAEEPTGEAATPPSEPPQTPPQAANPPPLPESPTGIKNAIVDADRQKLGLPPAMQPAAIANGDAWNHALRILDADPNAAARLEDSLRKEPKSLDPYETALLTHRKITLETEHAAASDAINKAADAGDRAAVSEQSLRKADALDALQRLYDVTKKVGTKSGQSLQARKLLVNRDYTLASMLAERRAENRGEKLTPEIEKEVEGQFQKIQQADKALNEKLSHTDQEQAQAAAKDAVSDIQKEIKAEPKTPRVRKPKTEVPTFSENAKAAVQKQIQAARDRIASRRTKLYSNPLGVVSHITDEAIIGAGHILNGAITAAEFGKRMIAEFGEKIRPHLDSLWDQSKRFLESQENTAKLTDRLSARSTEGEDISTLHPLIRSIAKEVVRGGARGWEEVTNGTHEIVKDILPDISERQTMDAISGYGRQTLLSKDEVSAALRDAAGQMQQVSKIQDMQEGQAPKKTGPERREPTAEERALIKQVNELKKKGGFEVTDPEKQLKTALGAVKTRLQNEIDDLSLAISKREALPKKTGGVPYDQEAKDLRARRDELKAQYDSIFKKPGLTDEARLKTALDAAKRSEENWNNRLENARKGVFDDGTKRPPVSSAELDAIRARRDAVKAEVEHLKATDSALQEKAKIDSLEARIKAAEDRLSKPIPENPEPVHGPESERVATLKLHLEAVTKDLAERRKEAAKLTPQERTARNEEIKQRALQKQIDTLKSEIAAGEVGIKTPSPKFGPETEAVTRQKAELDALRKQREMLRESTGVNDAANIARYKASLAARIADLKERTAKGDFAPRTPKPRTLDAETIKLQAEANAARTDFQRGLEKDRMAKRQWWEKLADVTAAWGRFSLMANPLVYGKLVGASAWRLGSTYAESAPGGLFRRMLPELAKRAPYEGRASNLRQEARALADGIVKGVREITSIMKHLGESELDRAYGKPHVAPKNPWLDWAQATHAATKNPIKRIIWERSFARRMEHAAENGVNVADPMEQMKIGNDAFKDAERSIFLQDNKLSSGMNAFFKRMEAKDKNRMQPSVGGKVIATAGRLLVPIARVPTNIVSEGLEYALGLAKLPRAIKLNSAAKEVLDTLHPDEADEILRNLKKGSLGLAIAAAAYFARNSIGGLFVKGSPNPNDLKPGEIKAGGVTIPARLLHSPAILLANYSATIGRLAEQATSKRNKEPIGLPQAFGSATVSAASEVPMFEALWGLHDIGEPGGVTKFFGNLAASRAIPGVVSTAAKRTDLQSGNVFTGETVKRKPESFGDYFKLGIPGLREQVQPPSTVRRSRR